MHPQSRFDPGFAAFGGGSSGSVLHPLVMGAMIVLALSIFLLPRRQVIVPLILGLLLIPQGQNLYIAGAHLYMSRVLILFGMLRLVQAKISSQANLFPGGFSILDKVFLVWAIYRTLAPILQYMQWGAVPEQLSFLWAALGSYFLFRWLLQDEEDVLRLLKALAAVALVCSIGMIFEQMTGRNMFGFLGGIRVVSEVRDGRIRSQGIFGHPILGGSFGAMMVPLFLWLWVRGKAAFSAVVGVGSCMVIVFASWSSTPIMALMGGILALFLFPIRKGMRLVRWGIVATLVGLQCVMKAPVWFALQHLDVIGASSGWNRANLIDNFIRHFSSWWFIGTHDNVNWGYDMWDSCNQFVSEGITGGLICFVAFVVMFVLCFQMIGNARKAVEGDTKEEWLMWFLGAALLAQIMVYFGIDYFDQMAFVWYAVLVIIPVVTLYRSAVTAPAPAQVATFRRDRFSQVRQPTMVRARTEPHSTTPWSKVPSR